MRAAPGTITPHRIELPTPFADGTVNSYLFTEPDVVLVDVGVKSPASWDALVAGLAARNVTVGDIDRLVLSHAHTDHIGLAGRLLDASGATAYISPLGAPWLLDFQQAWRSRVAYYQATFLPALGLTDTAVRATAVTFEGLLTAVDSVPVERVRTFALDGQIMLGGVPWQVLHLPGHAGHLTCFFEPVSGHFLSSDMLLHRTPAPVVEAPPPGRRREPGLPQYLESLRQVEALPIQRVWPGHGAPFDGHRGLIARQRARIEARREECLALIAAGRETVYALGEVMYGAIPPQFRFVGYWMLVGYLDLLLADGRVSRREIDGIWRFAVAERPSQ